MRKRLTSIFAALIAVIVSLNLSACNGGEHKHTVTEVAATQSTCDTHGYSAHYKCTGCGKLFDSASAENEITLADIELPFRHTATEVAATQSTCDTHGYSAHYKCTGCGKLFDSASADTEITLADIELPFKHTVTEVAATQSTCDTHGYPKHYKCTGCGKLFDSETANNEITLSEIGLPFRHTYSEDLTGDEKGHWHACTLCGAKDKVTAHSKVYGPATPATDFTDGKTGDWKCRDCGFEKEGVVIPKRTAFVQREREGLNYCLYEPSGVAESNEKVPLVLFLHGAGERGNDNAAQLKNCIQQVVYNGSKSPFMQSVVIAPQCPSGMQWVDTPWANGNYTLSSVAESATMKKVVKLLEYYKTLDYIDTDRIYVVGISMGGFGTWDLLARHSDIFAAGVPICGGGATDAINTLKNMPIYTFHGTADPNVPYSGTQAMVNGIKSAGGNSIYFHTYEGAGHIIWDDAIKHGGSATEPNLAEWLFAQKKTR